MPHDDLKSYLTNINFLEEPLVGLCAEPLHTMSPERLREWVQEQRTTRENRATFKAKVNAETVTPAKDASPKVDIFGQFS